METLTFGRIKKKLSVLLLVSFIMFVTAASASANAHDKDASAIETADIVLVKNDPGRLS